MGLIKRDIKHQVKKILNYASLKINKVNINDKNMYIQLYGKESVVNREFCNISAGGHFDFGCGIHHPVWTNIDVNKSWKRSIYFPKGIEYNPAKDIDHDLISMKEFPVNSSSINIVHSRLAIEHINDAAALYMFKEVFRILKKGGLFRVIAPNIDLDYKAYQQNDLHFFDWFPADTSIEQRFLFHFAAAVSEIHHDGETEKISDSKFRELFKKMSYEDALNYCTFRCSDDVQRKHRNFHMNWWNPQKLERMLKAAGFSAIYLSAAGQSQSPVLRNPAYFDNWYATSGYAKHMFYMEAVK